MQFLKRLFEQVTKRKTAPHEDEVEAPIAEAQLPSSFWALNETQSFLAGSALSTGIVRAHNEDSLLVMMGNFISQDSPPGFGVFLVADGMGGHRSGEVASSISVRTVARRLTERTLMQFLSPDPRERKFELQELLREALEEANRAVVENVPGGGTTLTAAVIHDGDMFFAHVGDSRAYVISDGTSEVLTRDHSLVERLVELEQLTEEEAASHPQRNVLYRAIGQGPNLEIDTFTHPVPRGGHLLLCSDGLWGEVSDREIRRIVCGATHPQDACDELVRAANAAGGPDNISAVVVRFPKK
jgi:serine/threonine protein phosphatase PrpC